MLYNIPKHDKSHAFLVSLFVLLRKPKINAMKYNITKSDVTTKKQVLKFLGRGLSENDAVNILFEQHGMECCKLFQDVSEIMVDSDSMIYFEVMNNMRIFRYELEVDAFSAFNVFRPKTSIAIDIINHKN